jgi:uncharacterized phiE125 gp8 family phage protein
MVIKLNTGPTTEPVQLADVLTHLRLDSTAFGDNIVTTQSIVPGAHTATTAAYSLIGTGVNIAGHRVIVNLNSGTNGATGTVDAKIQESDSTATADYTDWTGGAFTQVTTSNDNAIQEKEYTGSKPYIRVVAKVTNATCDFGVDVIASEYTPDDASYLSNLITLAREHVENNVLGGVALINQTWEYYLREFPKTNYIELPRPPLSSITSITYTESGDTTAYQNTFSSTNYSANTVRFPGKVQLYDGCSWPSSSLETNEPIKVVFVAGYGANRTYVPTAIKQCILMYVDELYQQRGIAEVYESGARVINNPSADLLVAHYRLWSF